MPLNYRRATEEDWAKTTAIEKDVSDGKTFKAYTNENEAREYLRKSEVYFVLLNNEIIGTVSFEKKSDDHAYIDVMTILKKHQGHNYGDQSLKWLLAMLKTFKLVDLVTHPHNSKAISIYLKNGFIIDSWIDNYFGDGEPRLRLLLKRN